MEERGRKPRGHRRRLRVITRKSTWRGAHLKVVSCRTNYSTSIEWSRWTLSRCWADLGFSLWETGQLKWRGRISLRLVTLETFCRKLSKNMIWGSRFQNLTTSLLFPSLKELFQLKIWKHKESESDASKTNLFILCMECGAQPRKTT